MALTEVDVTSARLGLRSALDGDRTILVLSAPGGFGKSAFLRRWRESTSTDPRDWEVVSLVATAPLDGREFWRRALEALSVAPSSESVSERDLVMAELQRLSADRAILLTVDGLDHVVDDAVAAELANLVGSGVITRLVASMRRYSSTWRRALAARFPLVLGADDLAFTSSEVDAFIEEEMPVRRLASEGVLAVTGGWPVLVRAYLATLNRSGSTDAAEAEVAKTLASLLDRASGGTTGLAHVSVLALSEELSPEIARELSGEPDVENLLERLLDDGLLEEDPVTRLLRWPSSVRVPLMRALRTVDGASEGAHSRISDWYLSRNAPAPALRHATLAQDWPRVIAILEKNARTLLFAHTYSDLYEALHRIPMEHAATSPHVIALRDIWLQVPDEMLDEATRLPESEHALTRLGRSPQARDVLEAGYLLLMALSRRGLSDRARAYGARLVRILDSARASQPQEILELYPSLQLHVGLIHLIGGDHDAALSSLWRAFERADDNPRPYIRADAASKTALTFAVMGDHQRTTVWLDRYAAAPLRSPQFEARIRCTANAARLLMAVDQLDMNAARKARALLLESDTYTEEIFWAYLAYAETQYALLIGTQEDTLEHVLRVESHYERWTGNGAIAGPLLAAAKADLLMALGRANPAKKILEGPYAGHPLLQVGKARLALITGQPSAALRYAADSAWMQSATTRQRIDMRLIQAIAAARADDPDLAQTALRRATDAALQVGALRPFRTVPESDLRRIADKVPGAEALIDEAGVAEVVEQFPTTIALITLTPRESEILERLTAALSLQQIAISMRLSYNTVKVHVRGLYAKLGVSSRDDAIAQARRHGLL